jgi:hypothetical protein
MNNLVKIGEIVKVKYSEAIQAFKTLQAIAGLQVDENTAYWLGRNFKWLEPVNKKFENQRVEIIKKYGVEDKKTGSISIPKTIGEGENEVVNPDADKAQKELDAVLESEVDVHVRNIELSKIGKTNMSIVLGLDFILTGFPEK